MDEHAGPVPSPRPPWAVILGIAAVVGLIAWAMLRMYTSPVATECARGYRAAHTAVDSARVDSLIPNGEEGGRTCGSMRATAER